ncbi:hypothetical protein glysoja_016136 [Glycine soja]|nr:hypothetical protein glysoja_016136 [Glycine soja]
MTMGVIPSSITVPWLEARKTKREMTVYITFSLNATFLSAVSTSGTKGRNGLTKSSSLNPPPILHAIQTTTTQGLGPYISEIVQLCTEFPSTVVLLDHLAFCKPPSNEEEGLVFSQFLNLSRFPQVFVKFSGLFRLSRGQFSHLDLSPLLSQVVSSFGANRLMWGTDFPYVVPECGYNEANEALHLLADQISLPSTDLEWMMGRTVTQLFPNQ